MLYRDLPKSNLRIHAEISPLRRPQGQQPVSRHRASTHQKPATTRGSFGHRKVLLRKGFLPFSVSGRTPRMPLNNPAHSALDRRCPRNVFLISAQSQVSTYALCEHSDSAIIYGTKTGVELSAFGIPVVVAGEAWIRNKGLTMDATSPQNYFEILNTLPIGNKLSEETTLRAKKYAYHFFFRRFIPLRCVAESKCSPPFEVAIGSYRDLLPTADPGLDLICNGILRGIAFVYKAELSKKWL